MDDKSYTDTLNRLFPWGCETESAVVTELVRRVEELVSRGHTGHHHRLALARRIKELEGRIEQLERLLEKGHKKED